MDRELLSEYNRLWRRTRHFQALQKQRPYLHDYKANQDRLRLMGQLEVWCRARAIEPKAWLWYLFDRRRWSYPPKLTAKELLADARCGDFRTWDFTGYRAYCHEQPEGVFAPLYDPNRDVTPAVEMDKARWLREGAPEQCLSRIWSETLGYHPYSRVCALCALAAQCAHALQAGLPFDVLALRRGEISSDTARMQYTARSAATPTRTAPHGLTPRG